MANEFIIKNGFHSKGDSQVTGSLSITGISDVSASIAAASGGGSAFPFTGDAVITGSLTISGSANIFKFDQTALIIGKEAGNSLTSFSVDNTFLGYRAGYQTSTGDQNIFVGDQAGYIGDHTQDVAIGYRAGSGYTGGKNVSIGWSAGLGALATSAEKHNTQIGAEAGRNNWRGSGNTFIGYRAGFNGYDNEGCIIIGSGSIGGPSSAAGGLTQQLRIGNGNSLVTISASLETGDVIFYNTASAPNFSGSFQGDGSALTGISPFPFTGDAQITGSLIVSSSVSPTIKFNDSVHSTYNVVSLYKISYSDPLGDKTLFADDRIQITWDASANDVDGKIISMPSSGRVQSISQNGSTTTAVDMSLNTKVVIEPSLDSDEQCIITLKAPDDATYPIYRLTISEGSTSYYTNALTVMVEIIIP